MSDVMYNKVPGYYKGSWRTYCVHDDNNIKGFFGDYRYLSNFEPAITYFEGQRYPSSENAYQAAKVIPDQRGPFTFCSAAQSKKIWKEDSYIKIYTPATWDIIKYEIMSVIVFDKFYRNRSLREKLIETREKYLEETNNWGDIYWGVVRGIGQNNLGKILMKTRQFWRK